LSSISKIIEKIVCKHLLEYLTLNKLISDKQFGFRSRHSTVDALLSIQKIALESVNARKKCSIVSLDLCKAYDTVDHKLLISKLAMNGLDDIALNWFHSYLKRRKEFVKFNNIISSELPLSMSIPQGTILGPVLFSIFINDITEL
jgi:hypothetical protein